MSEEAGSSSSISADADSYLACMEEIKRRILAIDEVLQGKRTTSFSITNHEFVALQFRKIFELIVLATLASHKLLFGELARKLQKEWQIGKVIAQVQKENPAFFPKPKMRVPSRIAGVVDDLIDITSGALTLEELIEAHGRLGDLMHASNPYRKDRNELALVGQFSEWRAKIIRLLNNHIITMPGEETLFYVGMRNEQDQAHYAVFRLVGKAPN